MSENGNSKVPVIKTFDDLYPGRFLRAGNLQGQQVTLTIADFHREELEGEKGKKVQAIFSFKERPVQIVFSKLNATCVKAMFGADVQQWKGKRITLYATAKYAPIKPGQECIRVYGSPDIAQDVNVTIALPRRKPFDMTMHRVVQNGGKGGGARSAAGPAAPMPAPASEHSDAEPPEDDFPPSWGGNADDYDGRMP